MVFGHPSGSSVHGTAGLGWRRWMLRTRARLRKRWFGFWLSVAALPWARAPLVVTLERPRVARPYRPADLGPSAAWRHPRESALGAVAPGSPGYRVFCLSHSLDSLLCRSIGGPSGSSSWRRVFSLRCEGVRGSFGVRSGARSEVSMSLWTGFGPFVEAPGRSIAFRSLAWWRLFGAVETSFRV